ncbi:hypothetical protein QE152_g38377 [Popillia japonica]|uniref:Uncharacterized protein n=1 Tax=Popillia japonica TaxID=7064 RepID=A0AAW1HX18_POPJA
MGSVPNICQLSPNALTVQDDRRPSVLVLKRLFSRDSIANTSRYTYDLYPPSNYEYSLCGKEFLLKIAEILVSVICAGLFTDGVQQNLEYSTSSVLFPNVVFSSCIINTSVIALGYVLGQVMPEVLIRAFNAIAVILFFVSACITAITWFAIARHVEGEDILSARLLLAQVFTSSLNVILYAIDIAISIRKSLRGA